MPEEQRQVEDVRLQRPPGLLAGQPPEFGPTLEAADLVGRRQIAGEGMWVQRIGGVLGFAWPFVVALFGIVLTAADIDISDQVAFLLSACSFLGTPVVVARFYQWLPASWPEGVRFLVTLLLAGPCVLVGIYLASLVSGAGYMMAGGYIPC
jgi:hypothetical protein